LAILSLLPDDLANDSVSEFVGLVRWGLYREAADLAASMSGTLRADLFSRLKELPEENRRRFSKVLFDRDIRDVLVPGIEPPPLRPWRN
jgi:hypothetical protein